MGASVSRILRGVLSRGGRLVLIGILIGGITGFLIAPRIQDLLFRQPARDLLVFGGVAVVLALVGVLATLVPAFRATRVDPNTALRAE
jgi:ABC-type antimicrobial peptide transport system permease subunit